MRNFGQKGDAELVPMYPASSYGTSYVDFSYLAKMNKASNFQNVSQPKVSPQVAAVGLGAILAVGALNTFVVAPLIIKAFKPDFSYGRRVGISLGLSAGAAIVRGLILAAKKEP